MGVTVLFIGLVVGPLVGLLCGLWGIDQYKDDENKAKLFAGFTGWFCGAIAGAVISGVAANMILGNPAYEISLFGIGVYGAVIGAWVASMLAAAAGVVAAKVLR